MAVSKVTLNNEILMDITDATADNDKVISGYTAYGADGIKLIGTAPMGGNTEVITITDELDSHGGVIRTIDAIDISDTTAIAGDVTQGKYFYTAAGIKTLGTSIGNSTPEITISSDGAVTQFLQAQTFYHFTSESLTSLTITFNDTSTDQYHFDFISPSTAITLNLPQTVILPQSFNIQVNTKYEIDIYQNYAVIAEWCWEASS